MKIIARDEILKTMYAFVTIFILCFVVLDAIGDCFYKRCTRFEDYDNVDQLATGAYWTGFRASAWQQQASKSGNGKEKESCCDFYLDPEYKTTSLTQTVV